jgi:hypothetical protein
MRFLFYYQDSGARLFQAHAVMPRRQRNTRKNSPRKTEASESGNRRHAGPLIIAISIDKQSPCSNGLSGLKVRCSWHERADQCGPRWRVQHQSGEAQVPPILNIYSGVDAPSMQRITCRVWRCMPACCRLSGIALHPHADGVCDESVELTKMARAWKVVTPGEM